LKLLWLVNAERQAAGYEKIPTSALLFKGAIVRAFEQLWDRAA